MSFLAMLVWQGWPHRCADLGASVLQGPSLLLTDCIDGSTLAGHLIAGFKRSIHCCCSLERENHAPNAAYKQSNRASMITQQPGPHAGLGATWYNTVSKARCQLNERKDGCQLLHAVVRMSPYPLPHQHVKPLPGFVLASLALNVRSRMLLQRHPLT